jgi:raffinose/stachyose/melibiose transport system permease protein/N-acetylglucosamine transport system permease protein
MKKTLAEKIITWTAFVIFLLYAVTLVFPYIWMLINSLKTHQEFFQDIWGLPKSWMFSNYSEALSIKVGKFTFLDVLGNSIIYTVISTFLSVFFPTVSAYICSKYKFKLRSMCIAFTLINISVPIVGSTAATFKLFKTLSLYDKWYWGLFIMGSGGLGGSYLLLKAALDNTSWTYAEAGFIDGASDILVMFKIMLPMITPVIIIMTIMGAIGAWNNYMSIWLYAPSYPTIGVALKQLNDNLSSADASYPKLFALMAISLVPVMAVFISFQKTIMNNFALGGLKG